MRGLFLQMNPVRPVSSSELEAALDRPLSQIRPLRRRYRFRQRRRPVAGPYGDAVLALAVKLDGFLAVFPRNVTVRTTPPGAASYVSINQQLIGC
jgi:hypothetical protein